MSKRWLVTAVVAVVFLGASPADEAWASRPLSQAPAPAAGGAAFAGPVQTAAPDGPGQTAAPAGPGQTAAPAAVGTGPVVVGMGDSYSSGEGTGDYSGGTCDQSANAWSSQAFMGIQTKPDGTPFFELVACSGATAGPSDNSVLSQLSALGRLTQVVTLTAGGNDLGFADVLTACIEGRAVPSASSGCVLSLTAAQISQLVSNLSNLYTQILQKAPNAQVFVMGYPDIFPDGFKTCPNAGLTADEVGEWHAGQTTVNDWIQRTVQLMSQKFGGRMQYLAPPSFAGHDVCSKTPWANGLLDALNAKHKMAAFHPNALGNKAMSQILVTWLREHVSHTISYGTPGAAPDPATGAGGSLDGTENANASDGPDPPGYSTTTVTYGGTVPDSTNGGGGDPNGTATSPADTIPAGCAPGDVYYVCGPASFGANGPDYSTSLGDSGSNSDVLPGMVG